MVDNNKISFEKKKLTIEKVIEQLKSVMVDCQDNKVTGQIQLELNYSCGGLSKVYLINKTAIN